MNFKLYRLALVLGLALFLAGCGWKPDVEADPITPPWSTMKLPVGTANDVIFRSEPKEFRAVHKGDLKTAYEPYVETLKAQGWEMVDFKPGEEVTADFKKDGKTLSMRAYFFDGSSSAVVLEEK